MTEERISEVVSEPDRAAVREHFCPGAVFREEAGRMSRTWWRMFYLYSIQFSTSGSKLLQQ